MALSPAGGLSSLPKPGDLATGQSTLHAPPFPRSTILSLGYTVSDLHLFSHRSQGHRYQAAIEAAADKASLFVLNGDIFDFQWSFLASERETLDAAVAWIEALVATRPSCVFVFLIGNHDAVPAYLRALDSLSRRYANLRWQEHIFALGSRRFLHGDSLHGGVTSASLAAYRDSCNRKIYGVARRRFYEGITRIGLAAVLHKLVSDRFACQRVLRYLRNAYPESLDSVTDVYFGHTHNFLINYPLEGIRFHNCGGPFIGMRFAIQEFEYETNSLT